MRILLNWLFSSSNIWRKPHQRFSILSLSQLNQTSKSIQHTPNQPSNLKRNVSRIKTKIKIGIDLAWVGVKFGLGKLWVDFGWNVCWWNVESDELEKQNNSKVSMNSWMESSAKQCMKTIAILKLNKGWFIFWETRSIFASKDYNLGCSRLVIAWKSKKTQ